MQRRGVGILAAQAPCISHEGPVSAPANARERRCGGCQEAGIRQHRPRLPVVGPFAVAAEHHGLHLLHLPSTNELSAEPVQNMFSLRASRHSRRADQTGLGMTCTDPCPMVAVQAPKRAALPLAAHRDARPAQPVPLPRRGLQVEHHRDGLQSQHLPPRPGHGHKEHLICASPKWTPDHSELRLVCCAATGDVLHSYGSCLGLFMRQLVGLCS